MKLTVTNLQREIQTRMAPIELNVTSDHAEKNDFATEEAENQTNGKLQAVILSLMIILIQVLAMQPPNETFLLMI